MKIRSTNRIFIEENFLHMDPIILRGDTAHYIRNVLRLKLNNKIRVFNEIIGEYLAKIISCDKKEVHLKLELENQLRSPATGTKLSIAPCLIKNDRFSLMLDMVVQLGVTNIIPIISNNTVHKNFKLDRMKRIIIESVEQSERLDVPTIQEAVNLSKIDFSQYDTVIYANEYATTDMIVDKNITLKENILLIIGPEGGFTEAELDMMGKLPNAHGISLGANILRAETAMVNLVSVVSSLRNDALYALSFGSQ
jgi:16S rRNA (uracil1498-N3)-methyltransferase